mgnify:CR=1 FL=1
MTDEDADYFRRLPRNMVQNTMRILGHEDAVLRVDRDHFEVLSLRTPSRRVKVHRRDDLWRCRVDTDNNQDRPCSHILAARVYAGELDLPNTAATVWKKTDEKRDHSLETRAWEAVPTMFPELLKRLLEQGLPVAAPPPVEIRGRPPKQTYPLVYQSIMRVAWRKSLRVSRGEMLRVDHEEFNPYGSCGIATLSRFIANPATTTLLEKLLALTTWPARPYETIVHPDGTGLTEQHFGAYYDERYAKKEKKGPREHVWTYAEILWTYRYTMIAAIYAQQGPFGEAPWLIPLLERAALMLDMRELGGDKAYNSYAIDTYLAAHGIDSQIKVKANANPTYSSGKKKAYKRRVEEARLDPKGFAAKANRRNNAETGNHAFKAVLGDQVYSKNAIAQRNEILCMAIAYNLKRLVLLGLKEGVDVDFTGGAQVLAARPWVRLETVRS